MLPFGSPVVSGCISVDASRDTNSFLENVRARYPEHAHPSSGEAVTELLNCLQNLPSEVNLVGHGLHGHLSTGSGDRFPGTSRPPVDTAKYVAVPNEPVWTDPVSHLRSRVTRLRLWGCHTGAGNKGANFLFDMAKLIDAEVCAPTVWVYCGAGEDLSLEQRPAGQWQCATPARRPDPIPEQNVYAPTALLPAIALRIGDAFVPLPVSAVRSLEFREGRSPELKPDRSWSGHDVYTAVTFVEFDKPLTDLPSEPGAVVTGTLTLQFEYQRHEERRLFYIYNDLLVRDMTTPDVYYRANTAELLQWGHRILR